jgi:uncharacterized protein
VDRPSISLLFRHDGRLRPIWRIGLFFCFFALFAVAGHYAVSVLPRHPLQWGTLLATTLAALLAGWIMLARIDQRPPGALGFAPHAGAVRESLFGIGIGAALIGAAVLFLLVTGAAGFVPDTGTPADYFAFLGWTFLFFAVAAALEEAIFRGYPFQVLVEWIGVWPAIVVAAILFSFLHAQNPNVTALALANISLAGVLLSLAYLKSLSLWFATGLHLGWNWTMASLFDFPVSGLEFDTPLYSGVPAGAAWWTGGAFGPEAGLVGTIVLVAGIFWLVRTRAVAPAPEVRQLRPLVASRIEKEEPV